MPVRGLSFAVAVCVSLCACASTRPRESEGLSRPGASFYTAQDEGCKPVFRIERDPHERHSCWNRLWEVPAAIVVVPVAAAVIVGVATSPIWVPILVL